MLISIILPTYNGAQTIKGAIESVIAQSYTDWELLIINDGSTDGVGELVQAFLVDPRIRYIKNEQNIGIQKTLNCGLHEARGDYIARIDDDDVWSDTTKLQQQIVFLTNNPEYVLVGTGAILVDREGKEFGKYLLPQSDQSIRERILRKNCFAHPSVVYSAIAARAVEGYSESPHVRHVEDHDLWLKLGQKGKVANLPIYAVTLGIHAGSITARYRSVQARRMIGLAWRYGHKYPYFLIGLTLSILRYIFFLTQRVVPFPKRWIYKIQSIQRGL